MNTDHQSSTHAADSAGEPSWFEQNGQKIVFALYLACGAVLVAELVCSFYKPFFDDHHPAHFEKIENIFGYQAVIGFVAFVCVVFLGKFLRLVIRRPEEYYDR